MPGTSQRRDAAAVAAAVVVVGENQDQAPSPRCRWSPGWHAPGSSVRWPIARPRTARPTVRRTFWPRASRTRAATTRTAGSSPASRAGSCGSRRSARRTARPRTRSQRWIGRYCTSTGKGMVPARIRSWLLPVRQEVSPSAGRTARRRSRSDRWAAVRHQADDEHSPENQPGDVEPPNHPPLRSTGHSAGLPLPCQGTVHNPSCPTGLVQFTAMTDPDFEILRPDLPRGRFKAVLFDFDGTLSLLREGWPRSWSR